MGRNISENTKKLQGLADKYAIGELVDMVGVPDVYNAGDSVWMKTNTWVPSSDLSEVTKSNLKESNIAFSVLTDNLVIDTTCANVPGMLPPAIVGDTVCYPYSSSIYGTSAMALVINGDGITVVPIGQTCRCGNHGEYGGGHQITSDGTKFWSWTADSSGTQWAAYTSTDGLIWTSQIISGAGTMLSDNNHAIGMSGTQLFSGCGIIFKVVTSFCDMAMFCGVYHLLIGVTTSNYYMASRSSNGVSWGGNEATSILGSAAAASGNYSWYYRNNMRCFICMGSSVRRFTSDGGANWSSIVGLPNISSSGYFKVNKTDPDSIVYTISGSATAYITTDTGASWNSITLPFIIATTIAITGSGTTWVISDSSRGVAYKTTNNGTTWDVLIKPIGVLGSLSAVYRDEYRWYLFSGYSNQIAVSTDLTTWIIRNINTPSPGTTSTYIPFDVSTIGDCIIAPITNKALYSIDAGVTWYWATISSATYAYVGGRYLVSNTVGTECFISGHTITNEAGGMVVRRQDILTGGKFFKSTTAVVSPLRTNAVAYSRVQ